MAADERDSARVGGEQLGRSSMEAFRAIAENSLDLILRFDRKFRHVYLNPAAERQMRRPRHAIRGKTQRELGMPDDVAGLWEEALERVFRSGRPRRFEFELGASWVDAQEHFEAFASAETGAHGEVETVLVVVRDVSERVRAGKALAARTEALARAQRIAGCGSFYWDAATDALEVSEELRRLLPFASDEPATLGELVAVVHDDDRASVGRTLEEAIRAGRPWSMQFRVLDRDGAERVLRSRGEVVAGEAGSRLYGTALDVTDQEDVQSTVRQLLRFSQFAIDHIDDAVVWIDAGGRILSANRAASERFGERAEALVGQPIGRLGLQQSSESWTERWHELRRAGRVRYEVDRPGGTPVEISAHYAVLHGQESVCMVVARERRPAATAPRPTELAHDLRTLIAENARAQERLLETLLGGGASGATTGNSVGVGPATRRLTRPRRTCSATTSSKSAASASCAPYPCRPADGAVSRRSRAHCRRNHGMPGNADDSHARVGLAYVEASFGVALGAGFWWRRRARREHSRLAAWECRWDSDRRTSRGELRTLW